MTARQIRHISAIKHIKVNVMASRALTDGMNKILCQDDLTREEENFGDPERVFA